MSRKKRPFGKAFARRAIFFSTIAMMILGVLGVNEGDINYFQKEGFIFKTYVGKMIQTGLKSTKGSGSIQSNEFKFSVVEPRVAERINEGSNVGVKLHWKRYLGTLPWRGNSQFIVDSIYSTPSAKKVETPLPTEIPDAL